MRKIADKFRYNNHGADELWNYIYLNLDSHYEIRVLDVTMTVINVMRFRIQESLL